MSAHWSESVPSFVYICICICVLHSSFLVVNDQCPYVLLGDLFWVLHSAIGWRSPSFSPHTAARRFEHNGAHREKLWTALLLHQVYCCPQNNASACHTMVLAVCFHSGASFRPGRCVRSWCGLIDTCMNPRFIFVWRNAWCVSIAALFVK